MNDIQIVSIDEARTDSNALYHCDACTGAYSTRWPRWRIEAGLNHGGNTRTMRLCEKHRRELLIVLVSHDAQIQPQGKHERIT